MEKTARIIIIIIISGAILFFGFYRIRVWNRTKIERAIDTERAVWLEKIGELEEKIANLEEVVSQQKEALVPKEKLEDGFCEDSPAFSSIKKNISFVEITHKITSFTTYLDFR